MQCRLLKPLKNDRTSVMYLSMLLWRRRRRVNFLSCLCELWGWSKEKWGGWRPPPPSFTKWSRWHAWKLTRKNAREIVLLHIINQIYIYFLSGFVYMLLGKHIRVIRILRIFDPLWLALNDVACLHSWRKIQNLVDN